MLTKVKGRIKRFACVFLCMALLFFTFGIQKPILFFRIMDVEEYDGVLIHSFLACPEVTCRLYEDGSITYSVITHRRSSGEPVPNKLGGYMIRWYDSRFPLLGYAVNSIFNLYRYYGSRQLSKEEFDKLKDYINKVDSGDFAGPEMMENEGFYIVYKTAKKTKTFYAFTVPDTDLTDFCVELLILAPFSTPYTCD